MVLPCPQYSYREEIDYGLIVSAPAQGRVVRGRTRPTKIRKHYLIYENRPKSDMDAIEAEFAAAKGNVGTFSYTSEAVEPGKVPKAVTVRFQDPELKIAWDGPRRYSTRVVLIEEVDPTS